MSKYMINVNVEVQHPHILHLELTAVSQSGVQTLLGLEKTSFLLY